MGRPDPLLVDVAAGRPVDPAAVTERVLADATAHGMAGHLHDALVAAGGPVPAALARADLAGRARVRRWWEAATAAVGELEAAGFGALVLKGAAEEEVAGLRPGTRVPADVDVLLHPDHAGDLAAAARVLDAAHVPRPSIHPLLSTPVARPGTLVVDLHVDALKMARPAWRPERPWAGARPVAGHPEVRTFGPSTALVVRCAHHARDGYRSLEHHATIRALATAPGLDPDAVRGWADEEGIGALVAATLRVVTADLDVAPLLDPAWHARTPRRLGWAAVKPAGGRLLGPGRAPVRVWSRAEWALVRRGGAVELARTVARRARAPRRPTEL